MQYYQQPVQLPVGQSTGVSVVQIPFTASYIAVANPNTLTTVTFAVGQLNSQPPGAMVVNPKKSYTGQMTPGTAVTVFWTSSSPIAAGGQNEVIVSASDQPITMQVSDNGVVVIEGNVTATFAPGQSVTIAGQPTVQFAAGQTVDINTVKETVNIQGDTTSAITNEYLRAGNCVSLGTYTYTVSNLAPGASTGAFGPAGNLGGPGVFDALWVRIQSANGYATQYNLVWNDFQWGEYGLVSNENQTFTGWTGTNNDTSTWGPRNNNIGITNPLMFNEQLFDSATFTLVNTSTTETIPDDTVTIEVICKYASETVTNPITNPVQQQSAQTMGASGHNGFFNTDGSQGTQPGTAFGVTPSGTQYITQFGLYYRNTGNVTQNILISTGGGLNIFEDNVPAGAVLDFKWDYAYGANVGDLYCTYSQADCGIINFWSNGIAYPQQHVPSTVK